MGGPEKPPPLHRSVLHGSVEEAAQVGSGGGQGGHGEGFRGIWPPDNQYDGLQVPWPHPHGHGQQLSGGFVQSAEGTEEVVADFKDNCIGGGKYVDVRDLF